MSGSGMRYCLGSEQQPRQKLFPKKVCQTKSIRLYALVAHLIEACSKICQWKALFAKRCGTIFCLGWSGNRSRSVFQKILSDEKSDLEIRQVVGAEIYASVAYLTEAVDPLDISS